MPAKSPTFDLDSVTPDKLAELVNKIGGQRAFSRKYGVPRSTLQLRLAKAAEGGFTHRPAPSTTVRQISEPVARFILTSAQESTELHYEFLAALEAYRDSLQALGPCELIVAGFTYSKRLFGNNDPKKVPYWHPWINQYRVQERIRLGDGIDFCGEMNTRPTAKSPLQGFETYTRHRWGIIPHAKVQLKSVPTMKHEPAKIIMTTGAVTKPNYIPMRAGIEASFHHALGAVLVEIAADGTFFCRHLLGEADGSFYDLDTRVEMHKAPLTEEEREERRAEKREATSRYWEAFADGSYERMSFPDDYLEYKNVAEVTHGHRIEAVNWGDLHVAQIDPVVSETCFGIAPTEQVGLNGSRVWIDMRESRLAETPLIDVLRPKYQFFHDVADFQSRNHHNIRDAHHMFELFIEGVDLVEEELREVAYFIDNTKRDFCQTVIVESNHDLALKRWLKEADYRQDPPNAIFFLECQLASYKAIRDKKSSDPEIAEKAKKFSIFNHVLTTFFEKTPCAGVEFLREDQSFRVLDIEKGMHGHLGANGARGNPRAFTKMGPKATTGHTHSCEIHDGIYTSGTSSKLDMGYNKGLSSWSQSHVITYQNGKRAILTMNNGKWRL
ncbi:DNA transfer protein [Caulobacter phage CcrColossus]|uniref:Putative T5 A1-like protein n=1 Tax=Caulobacter phage CcrColossus TaxID=1211640 RepID=K4JSE6_9CAUD|nr:DNA transfer protein [Caulobacter phage CcrColossus]AFU88031.1 putative T5 A1-like protein [Caulobacter phage CcrColossus]